MAQRDFDRPKWQNMFEISSTSTSVISLGKYYVRLSVYLYRSQKLHDKSKYMAKNDLFGSL